MAFVRRWFRRFALWGIPFVVMALLLVCGFVYWALATQAGTRWALDTALPYAGGQAQGVSGSVWDGLSIDNLTLELPDTHVGIEGLRVQVNWRELLERRLHVLELSARTVDVGLNTPAQPAAQEPFQMPELPVYIAVDKLALGRFSLTQDGVALPLSIADLSAALAVGREAGQLRLHDLVLSNEAMQASVQGELELAQLKAPFPARADIQVVAQGLGEQSPICARQYLPGYAVKSGAPFNTVVGSDSTASAAGHRAADAPAAREHPAGPGADCVIHAQLKLDGSLEQAALAVQGSGQGYSLDAKADLTPLAAVPVRQATLALHLPDQSRVNADFAWEAQQEGAHIKDHFTGQFSSDKLDLHALLGNVLPDALINGQGRFDVTLVDKTQLVAADVDVQLLQGSRWNKQAAAGQLKARVASAAQPGSADWWRSVTVSDALTDVKIGDNRVSLKGGFGTPASVLDLQVQMPHAGQLWPGLELGKASVQGVLKGSVASHALELKGQYDLGGNTRTQLGQGLAQADLALAGNWNFAAQGKAASWDGRITRLNADHAGLGLKLQSALPVLFTAALTPPAPEPERVQALEQEQGAQTASAQTAPGTATVASSSVQAVKATAGAGAAPWSVRIGASSLATTLDGQSWISLRHVESRYQAGQWASQAELNDLVLSEPRIQRLMRKLGLQEQTQEKKGGVKVASRRNARPDEIEIKAGWNLSFAGGLSGQVRIERVSGDIQVPAEPPFPLGLQDLGLVIKATPGQGGRSRLDAVLDVRTQRMGYLTTSAQTVVHATPGGGIALRDTDPKAINIKANIDDLGWTSLFLGDAMELGGRLNADVNIDVGAKWAWTSRGTVTGRDLRFTRLDDGIRLLNGSLDARFDDEIFHLDSLTFPAILRVEPKEWRTATWLRESPDAKDGKLTVSGQWNLMTQQGAFAVDILRFPIVQRADRYAMMSGRLDLDMDLPQVAIRGKVVADAGWFNLDMLGGIPTVDSDVVVLRAGQTLKDEEASGTTDMTMEIDVDLGPRFYLTGYGVNSGLVGNLRISMIGGKLTGIGALRTRGGRIELYGQKLLLRRGTVTFQGDITAPILDIEALRTNQAVQAGVKVIGTARRPRIDLVSYPEVSEVEKLSWLLLGHGPDDSGGDIALLLSVGTSFLG
ncbi:MAG TPA: translocation/assembly module TamB domain-containing protein, partial [Alcaligenes sp.]|nr:translocation/assembly module TamB domain-containing protein [Alcaligenes sp.]HRL27151.1 translocation/assembly module TamB domain-containing protein [Alcaligenes sp.]